MMRPQNVNVTEEILSKGIDIMLVTDISRSMLAMDFAPNNRIEASKQVVCDFIKGRKNDRIGLVIFAAHSFTQCPLTTDYGVLLELLQEVDVGRIVDGTAIGMGLSTAIKRIKDSDAKSKIIILLTDGVNNTGKVEPITAAKIAKTYGIKVYTIGMGKHGVAPYPYYHPFFGKRTKMIETKIDEDLLIEIAKTTGGKYFRAVNEKVLKEIYEKIDALEKTEIKTREYFKYKEYFPYFLWLALLLMLFEIFWFHVYKPKIP